jgi:hypothetical protein
MKKEAPPKAMLPLQSFSGLCRDWPNRASPNRAPPRRTRTASTHQSWPRRATPDRTVTAVPYRSMTFAAVGPAGLVTRLPFQATGLRPNVPPWHSSGAMARNLQGMK